ncbi:MAG: hemerythrin domain-containing protein, partial [Candidatus Omnitrophota bacterium]
VAIHNLPEERELDLMYRIEKTIYPQRDIKRPVCKGPKKAPDSQIKYSPPIKRLVDEHTLIKKWLGLIPTVVEKIDIESAAGRQLILDGLDFIRSYADKFHHAKEEDILFEYTDKNLDIIKTILADHETARGHVKAVFAAIADKDKQAVAEHLSAYKDLLTEHIKKEDEILYPWIERGLSTAQVGELFARFDEAEEKIDNGVVEKCQKFIAEAEQRIQNLCIKKEE